MNSGRTKRLINIKNKKNIKLINIGQILLICFLFAVIFLQTVGIISGLSSLNNHNADIFEHEANRISSFHVNQTPDIKPDQANSGVKTESSHNHNIDIENKNNYDVNNKNNINANTGDTNPETIFILGENNGKLAVFSPDGETVYETFDVYIDTLPDFDRDLLINGIKIKTADELHSLLEDYNS